MNTKIVVPIQNEWKAKLKHNKTPAIMKYVNKFFAEQFIFVLHVFLIENLGQILL